MLDVLSSFSDELVKIAASLSEKVRLHHQAEDKDWGSFNEALRSPRFAAEVRKNPNSDPKLKAYVTANNQYLHSKKVVATVPSETSSKSYPIKILPGGRLGCGCKDWQYSRSWKGTDCVHIKAAKTMAKEASPMLISFAAGMGLSNRLSKVKKKSSENGQQGGHW